MSFGDKKLKKYSYDDESDDDDAGIDGKKKKKKVSWMDSYNKLVKYYQVSRDPPEKLGRSTYPILYSFRFIYFLPPPHSLSKSRNINTVTCQGKKIWNSIAGLYVNVVNGEIHYMLDIWNC